MKAGETLGEPGKDQKTPDSRGELRRVCVSWGESGRAGEIKSRGELVRSGKIRGNPRIAVDTQGEPMRVDMSQEEPRRAIESQDDPGRIKVSQF